VVEDVRMTTRLTCLALALAALPAVTGAQQRPPLPLSTLTALDYFEIGQLVAKYARAIDTCSNNGYDYADLFTEDGFFAPEQNGVVGTRFQGRERLAEASGGGSRGCKNVGWIQQGVKHLYVNHIITPTAEGASGTVDMLMIGLGGDPNKISHEGYYEDAYVKTPKGWRFKSRIHHVPAASPNAGPPRPAPAK
jgi:actinorhodin biosynthesis protein ActVIA